MYNGSAVIRYLGVVLLVPLLLIACAEAPPRSEAPSASDPGILPVGAVVLDQGAGQSEPLDIAVEIFDRGLDGVAGTSAIPALRKAESIMLPTKLAATLNESGYWAAVRVTEAQDIAVPLTVAGKILRADGFILELEIRARGADGALLLDKRYRDEAADGDYPATPEKDPFADIYRAISNDLAAVARELDSQQRRYLERLALMDFAGRLAPDTFAGYVDVGTDGGRTLRSYPASGDPMLGRLQRLREQDYLFIDTVDQQYRDLTDKIGESYDLWRQYSRELELYGSSYRAQAEDRPRAGRRGSYAALQQVYGSFRKVKLQEEDLNDLVAGFAGESLETVMEVDDGVVSLRGSVSERYAEWRGILGRIYALESGLDAQP